MSSYQSASTSFDRGWSSRSSATSQHTEASSSDVKTHAMWGLRQQIDALQASEAACAEQLGRTHGVSSESAPTRVATLVAQEQKAMDDEIRGM